MPELPAPDQYEAQRRAKRDEAHSLGLSPYGRRTDHLLPLRDAFDRFDQGAADEHAAKGKEPGYQDRRPEVSVAGRVVLHRDNGKLVWMNLRDHTRDLQIAVSAKDVPDLDFKLAKLTDLGDVLVCRGRLMKTRTGEVTVWASAVEPGAKSLVTPPAKHDGLQDVELRYRRRYVDLWANPDTLRVFQLRSRLVTRLREFLSARGYLEVETPMLQTLAGGAAARPFKTHMNALDINLYLRIAPELYLKRLLVGGMPRVFEVNRNFRNEGLDKQHNPEFTMLEAYHAFGDCETVMELTESLVRVLAETVQDSLCQDLQAERESLLGAPRAELGGMSFDGLFKSEDGRFTFQDKFSDLPAEFTDALRKASRVWRKGVLPFGEHLIDYGRPFDRITYAQLFADALGFPPTDVASAREECARRHLLSRDEINKLDDVFIINELFEEVAEKSLDHSRPTFITEYPAALSPLTRPKPGNPLVAERADLFIAGMEIAPHYTELNDPDVQEAKFREQLKGLDDEESTFRTFDQDFIDALKVGMPPAGGMGLGIDRLVMLLTDQRTIRDVVLFPLMKPHAPADAEPPAGEERAAEEHRPADAR